MKNLPQGWKIEEWKNVLEIKNGKNQKAVVDENGQYPIYGSGGIIGYANDYLCEENAVVIGRKGSINNPLFVGEKFWNVDTAFGLAPNKKILSPKFLYYFALTYDFEILNTTTTIPSLTKERLKNISMPLPPLHQQEKIVNVLDTASALVEKQKALLEKYDLFLKSKFIEMFGDPIKNPMGWELRTFPEIIDKKQKYALKRGPFGGALKKEIFVEDGYLVYEQYHAINDDFSMGRYFINESKYQELEAFSVIPGDIIISCSGSLGRIAIIPDGAKKGVINQALLKVSLDDNIMNRLFFKFLFSSISIQSLLASYIQGSGIPNFPPMETIKSIGFICPPVNIQNQFVEIARKIESLIEKEHQKLEKLQTLYDALMKRAFDGEIA